MLEQKCKKHWITFTNTYAGTVVLEQSEQFEKISDIPTMTMTGMSMTGRCKHRNTGASTGMDRNTGESRRNAPEYTVCVNVYDVCVCSVWLYFVFNVSRTN